MEENIAKCIDIIIAKRGKQNEIIKSELIKVENFEQNLKEIKKKCTVAGEYGIERIKIIEEVLKKLIILKEKLKILETRFGRPYVSISTFGKTQDGKSTFWKSLTKINNDAILPIGLSGQAEESCTMTKVSYINNPKAKGEEITAKVIYYSKDEFIRMINANLIEGELREIDKNNGQIIDGITSLEQVSTLGNEIDNAISNCSLNSLKKKFERLKNYVTFYNDYINHLRDAGYEEDIDANKVEKYVRRRLKGDTKDNPGYLPVKEVIISSCINKDFGKIIFVDTRGIGESAFCVEEQLIDTLKYDSDGGMFIRKYYGDTATLNQHDNICDILHDIYQKINIGANQNILPWVQFVANGASTFKGDPIIKAFHEKQLSYIALFDPIYDVIDCLNNPTDVEVLVRRFVSYLAQNLGAIDQKLMENYDELIKDINRYINNLKDLKAPDTSDKKRDDAITAKIEDLNEGIWAIRKVCYDKRNEDDEEFKAKFNVEYLEGTTVFTLENWLPELKMKFDKLIKRGRKDAYLQCLDDIRYAFIDKYSREADVTFNKKVNKVKVDILKIFNKHGIPLVLRTKDGSIVETHKVVGEMLLKSTIVIDNIDDLIIEEGLKNLLVALNNFSIEINGLFLYLLRDSVVSIYYEHHIIDRDGVGTHRNETSNNSSGQQPRSSIFGGSGTNITNQPQNRTENINDGATLIGTMQKVESEFQKIVKCFEDVKEEFKKQFKNEYKKPSLILYGFIEEFQDRLRNSKDSNDALRGYYKRNFNKVFENDPIAREIILVDGQNEIHGKISAINYFSISTINDQNHD